jgi:uncharacterized membrane protein YphA (DoxX/SURF4 family)
MKTILTVSRIFTGFVFAFSGFVKAVDPVGTQIKFEDYFEAMGLDLFMPYGLFFSFLLNTAEFVTGLLLILNIFPKPASWAALLFLVIFTPLTFWLAIANPVSDCGCFGDAVKLTNWQTFGKNIVLLILIVLIFSHRKTIKSRFSLKTNYLFSSIILLIVLYFQYYNFSNLPIIDFRPFKTGVNIKENSTVPLNAPKDVYEILLNYKNSQTGEIKTFTVETIPDDTLWIWESTEEKLLSKGYEPPIQDFFISNLNKEDLTETILNYPGIIYILVLHHFEEGVNNIKPSIKELAHFAEKNNIPFYCFTASVESEIIENKNKLPENIEICTGDYKMLKTMIRTNPGIIILKNAQIINKKNYNKTNINEIKKLN